MIATEDLPERLWPKTLLGLVSNNKGGVQSVQAVLLFGLPYVECFPLRLAHQTQHSSEMAVLLEVVGGMLYLGA